MKKFNFVVMLVCMVVMLGFSAVAGAAPSTENPYKEAYKTEALAMRHPGTAQVIYLVLDERKMPLANATVVYNTTKARGLKAVSDAKGMIKFETKAAELFYMREIIVNGVTVPVSGAMVDDLNRNDIHRGTVRWNVIQQYSRSFVSYNAN